MHCFANYFLILSLCLHSNWICRSGRVVNLTKMFTKFRTFHINRSSRNTVFPMIDFETPSSDESKPSWIFSSVCLATFFIKNFISARKLENWHFLPLRFFFPYFPWILRRLGTLFTLSSVLCSEQYFFFLIWSWYRVSHIEV